MTVKYLTSGGAFNHSGLSSSPTGGRVRSGLGRPSISPEPSSPGMVRSTTKNQGLLCRQGRSADRRVPIRYETGEIQVLNSGEFTFLNLAKS